jgi:hypothetical protein
MMDENIKKESLKKNDNFDWNAFQDWARRDPPRILRPKKITPTNKLPVSN